MPPKRRAAKKATPLAFGDVLGLVRHLPGVEESTSYGTLSIKVKGKFMARLKEDGETLAMRTTFIDRDMLMRVSPETYFITDHYRDYPAVLVRLASADRAQLAELLEDEWRRLAPKKTVKQYDEGHGR
ncbi:MAG: MmcQ/YjbR family DNA-binding protein [Gemmatimonadota bacterium]|nr:MmcQ/YjbR family DNA-binding protein [Gemmatimonadota bacterium]